MAKFVIELSPDQMEALTNALADWQAIVDKGTDSHGNRKGAWGEELEACEVFEKQVNPYILAQNEDRVCHCGDCRYCDAFLSSDYDYETDEYLCSTCNGAGCARCE